MVFSDANGSIMAIIVFTYMFIQNLKNFFTFSLCNSGNFAKSRFEYVMSSKTNASGL